MRTSGTAAIIVTDFTTGAGGDMFRLSGDDGALLGLLSGWDGSSNPFGSGFLRLQQDGADTLLQWDQDGDVGGSDWETLVVFENTDADEFTDANFVPGYPTRRIGAGGPDDHRHRWRRLADRHDRRRHDRRSRRQ